MNEPEHDSAKRSPSGRDLAQRRARWWRGVRRVTAALTLLLAAASFAWFLGDLHELRTLEAAAARDTIGGRPWECGMPLVSLGASVKQHLLWALRLAALTPALWLGTRAAAGCWLGVSGLLGLYGAASEPYATVGAPAFWPHDLRQVAPIDWVPAIVVVLVGVVVALYPRFTRSTTRGKPRHIAD
ncbi:MAG: hypothetical protein QM820_23740 [Minicystis sp.]